ncbi:MAG: hypothetical protein ACK55I_48460, partial [bacterium]
PINAEGMAERLAFRWGKIPEDFQFRGQAGDNAFGKKAAGGSCERTAKSGAGRVLSGESEKHAFSLAIKSETEFSQLPPHQQIGFAGSQHSRRKLEALSVFEIPRR